TAYGLRLKPGYKVVANLPYQITSQVLRVLLEQENKPESITVMVQKEVAERIVAKQGDMSLLALSVQYYGEPKIITKVSKGNFWPEPKVDSAVLTISKISRVSKFTDEEFFRIARAGFANKRKQLWRNLSVGLGGTEGQVATCPYKKILKEVTGNEKVRAQELSVEEWRGVVGRVINYEL
ncbi:hypothetical protein KJ641_03075, partial [Patescibacteria group bacterium]|nr:hypothetical protein [Patescibacteria group bacterium]